MSASSFLHEEGRSCGLRGAAQGAADLLIVPVNDWKEVKNIHFQMAAFRAIENGIPLVRAAASGLSSAFDPWGRVLGVADFFAEGDRTMTVQVPVGIVPTLYARTGDLFAWLSVAALLLTLGIAAVAPRTLSARETARPDDFPKTVVLDDAPRAGGRHGEQPELLRR